MIGLFLLYFIWKYFSNLAMEYNKNKWIYGILGIITYYATTIFVGFVLVFLDYAMEDQTFTSLPNPVLGLIAFPFGMLAVWGFYKILQNQWSKSVHIEDADLLDTNY